MAIADELQKAVERLTKSHVLVGIPSTPRTEGPIDNATLGWIHETGSPAANIPARPFLRPGVEESKDQWIPYMRQAAEAAITGDEGTMTNALNAVGTTAVSAVKNTITAKIPPPLQPATVRARRRYRATPATAADIAGATPLVDTAQMINSITYVIKED